jgi:hypothetical protein
MHVPANYDPIIQGNVSTNVYIHFSPKILTHLLKKKLGKQEHAMANQDDHNQKLYSLIFEFIIIQFYILL